MSRENTELGRLRLESYTPFLLNRVALRMVKGSEGRFAALKLTVPSWRILLMLYERKVCRFGELAQLTSIEPATLSRLVGQLHRRGLVRRKKAARDARSMEISLSPRGEQLYIRSIPFALDVEAKLLDGLSDAEVRILRRSLVRMFENLKDHGEDS